MIREKNNNVEKPRNHLGAVFYLPKKKPRGRNLIGRVQNIYQEWDRK